MTFPLSLPAREPVITVTHPSKVIWVIELHNGEDSRLTHTLINEGMKPALDAVEKDWRETRRANPGAGEGALIIVGNKKQDKFFSNGLDFPVSSKDPNFFHETYDPMLMRLLAFPIPTVAAINGHCFAGGMMLTLACDYRVMTDGSTRRAWMCMNEVHFGAPWPLSFAAMLRAKVGDARLQRQVALEGHRFTPAEAKQAGLVDHLVAGGTDAVLTMAIAVGEKAGAIAKGGVWGLIKRDLYSDVFDLAGKNHRIVTAYEEDELWKAKL